MNFVDELNEMNVRFKLELKKQNATKGSNKFTDTKTLINGTKVIIKEMNEVRSELKLPKLVHTIRQCLNCFNKFHSQGAHNRMCDKCVKL